MKITLFRLCITLFFIFTTSVAFSNNENELYRKYGVIYQVDKAASTFQGYFNLGTTNTNVLSYGYAQFKAINGITYSFNSKSVKPPIWHNWMTVSEYIAKRNGDTKSTKCTAKQDEDDYRGLYNDTLPSHSDQYLKDSSGNKIFYETVINPVMVNYLDEKSSLSEVLVFPAGHNNYKKGGGKPNEFGSMVLKLAWKKLTNADDESRYYKVNALVLNGSSESCEVVSVGLISMHMVYKGANQLNWVWSTFSHEDNAPVTTPIKSEGKPKWSLYDSQSNAEVNTFNASGDNAKIIDEYPSWFKSTYQNKLATMPDALYQTYVNDIKNNKTLDFWKNYQQVGTQWTIELEKEMDKPLCQHFNPNINNNKGDNGKNLCVMPRRLTNTAIEPFVKYNDATIESNNSSTSCMHCHNGTATVNFLFFPKNIRTVNE
jgi:hypothetical protein